MAQNYESTLKIGDTGPPVRVKVKQNSDGKAPDWTLATVRFYMQAIDSALGGTGAVTEVINAVASVEVPVASSGILVYDWQPGDTDVSGRYKAFFTVTDQGGDVETYPEEGYIWITLEGGAL